MIHKKVSVFVDGENFRKSLSDLFPDLSDKYLPRTDWSHFFEHAVQCAHAEVGSAHHHYELMRCYWYVIGEFECNTYFNSHEFKSLPVDERLKYFSNHAKGVYGDPKAITDTKAKHSCADRCQRKLESQLKSLRSREDMWRQIQDGIQKSTNKLEFRRFGHIFVNLEKLKFNTEKGTDVKLALDLLSLEHSYDLAIVVSGDADYIPAVDAVKAKGKHVLNIDFLDRDGNHLPGGARKLKMHCDANISIPYETMKELMNKKIESRSTGR